MLKEIIYTYILYIYWISSFYLIIQKISTISADYADVYNPDRMIITF